jgi:hypothetical protein
MPRRRTLILGGIAAIVLLLIIAALRSANWFQPRMTQAEVRRQIEAGLPMGSTIAQVIAFLGTRGWGDPHDVGVHPNLGVSSSHGFEQEDPQGSTLTAAIRGAYPGFIVSGGIYMKFGFNARGRLTRYQLRDVYTGP